MHIQQEPDSFLFPGNNFFSLGSLVQARLLNIT